MRSVGSNLRQGKEGWERGETYVRDYTVSIVKCQSCLPTPQLRNSDDETTTAFRVYGQTDKHKLSVLFTAAYDTTTP